MSCWFTGTGPVALMVALAGGADGGLPLRVASAGALRPAVRALAAGYRAHPVELAFSSSQGVLDAATDGAADVVVVGHEAFLDRARADGLIDPASAVRVAFLVPVIVVPKGNPRAITALTDLLHPGVGLALADPGSTCLGATTRELFAREPAFEAIAEHVVFRSSSCEQTVGVVAEGRADAAVAWHVLPEAFSGRVDLVRLVGQDVPIASAWAAVTRGARDPAAARSFIESLTSSAGAEVFEAQGYPTHETQARAMTGKAEFRPGW